MKHLNVDEIINFVSITELNSDSVKFCAMVNSHIRACEKCLKLVTSFQMIYDEFTRLENDNDFKKFVDNNISGVKGNNETSIENQSFFDELEL